METSNDKDRDKVIIDGIEIKPFDKAARGSFKEVRRATAILKSGDVEELYALVHDIFIQSGATPGAAAIALDSISVAEIERIVSARYAVQTPPLDVRPVTPG